MILKSPVPKSKMVVRCHGSMFRNLTYVGEGLTYDTLLRVGASDDHPLGQRVRRDRDWLRFPPDTFSQALDNGLE